MKIRELRGAIYNSYDTEAQFAKAIGWPRQKLNKITNGVKEPTVVEINTLAVGLGLSVEEVAQFFLRSKSPSGRQLANKGKNVRGSE